MITYRVGWPNIFPWAARWAVEVDGREVMFGWCYGPGARERGIREALAFIREWCVPQ